MKLSGKKWNQGNLNETPFAGQRRWSTHQTHVDAPVDRVFERACLSAQPAWLPSEETRLLYSESGRDEQNALWLENTTCAALFERPGLPTYWTTTVLDAGRHRYQAALINPKLAMGVLDVTMTTQGTGTEVRFDLSYTVLSQAGRELFDAGMEARLDRLVLCFMDKLTASMVTETMESITSTSQKSQRKSITYERVIQGDIDETFALACPVAELLWIEDWKFDLIYSESGKNETGCVFLEPATGLAVLRTPGANTFWYTTLFDTGSHRFEGLWLTEDLTIARWVLTMNELSDGGIRVNWNLTYTGLSREGNHIIANEDFDGRMKAVLSFLSRCLQKYVETGTLYHLPTSRKLRLAASLIGTTLGRHFRRVRKQHPRLRATA